ncbi:MAG: (5-formylfuran-3-yl)methyl phosphate synthase [Candidatus Heimdallarchaeota archaeon]
MKLLVSPLDLAESRSCLDGGADILDVKNPKEGSLGANFPAVIRAIREEIGMHPLSATLGDIMYKPGTVALAAYGLASCGVDYIKVGLLDFPSVQMAVETLLHVKQSVKLVSSDIKVVAAGYADYSRVRALSPFEVLEASSQAGCDVTMLDTAIKDGKNLFFWLERATLLHFIEKCHEHGMMTALAGSLLETDIPLIRQLGTDIVGIRGAACSGNDRVHGRISSEKVRFLRSLAMGD